MKNLFAKSIFSVISLLIVTTKAKYCAQPRDDTLYIYPSANNCSTFFVCHNNEEIEMSCLESSLFMYTEERVCLEKCSIKTTTRTRTTATKTLYDYSSDYLLFPADDVPARTIICPSSGKTKAAIPYNCNEYIECDEGIGTRRICEIGSKFSSALYECLPETESDCKVDNNKKPKGSYISKCRFERGNSLVVFPSENCADFKKCANLMAWTITCAQNTKYSRERRSCEWADKVKCEK